MIVIRVQKKFRQIQKAAFATDNGSGCLLGLSDLTSACFVIVSIRKKELNNLSGRYLAVSKCTTNKRITQNKYVYM